MTGGHHGMQCSLQPPMLLSAPMGSPQTSSLARAAAGWPWRFAAPAAFGAAALGLVALLKMRAQPNGTTAPLPQPEVAKAGGVPVSTLQAESDAQAAPAEGIPSITSSGTADSPQPRAAQSPTAPLANPRPAAGALWVRKDEARALQSAPSGAANAAVPARVLWQRAAKRVAPANDSAGGSIDRPPVREASGAAAGWRGEGAELTDNVEGLRIGTTQHH